MAPNLFISLSALLPSLQCLGFHTDIKDTEKGGGGGGCANPKLKEKTNKQTKSPTTLHKFLFVFCFFFFFFCCLFAALPGCCSTGGWQAEVQQEVLSRPSGTLKLIYTSRMLQNHYHFQLHHLRNDPSCHFLLWPGAPLGVGGQSNLEIRVLHLCSRGRAPRHPQTQSSCLSHLPHYHYPSPAHGAAGDGRTAA